MRSALTKLFCFANFAKIISNNKINENFKALVKFQRGLVILYSQYRKKQQKTNNIEIEPWIQNGGSMQLKAAIILLLTRTVILSKTPKDSNYAKIDYYRLSWKQS
mgnify:CR=1 FL=1